MRKFFILPMLLFFCCRLQAAGYAQEGVVNMKRVVMIIAQNGFRDEELLLPKEILENAGIEVKVASITLAQAEGMLGAKVKPDILLSDINARDFDAVIFVGGMGASQYWNDAVSHALAEQALGADRIVAAICIAPVTLANAGILKGKRATVWPSEAEQLKAKGANYTGRPVEKDGNIITASGPAAASEFGEEVLKALTLR
ncbi:MAG: DJ-1/PfpI family protein [Candidatus Omnitrophica bacterium]|nr:DJ-1/PfpI family protein [Candidatus Omnitrophota bacterium]